MTLSSRLPSAAIAGVAVSYGLNLNMLQAWVIWNLCNLENKIISVERILQYTSIPSEPPLAVESHRPNSSWPSLGEVEIRSLQVRYAPQMPLVLRGLTCVLPGGKKTGIVGRTGSGKSTLIQTLFRIVDPSAGQILIDGTDIQTVGLHDLRSRLGIIPQDPTMFEGTLRSNLDPLEEHTDEEIWQVPVTPPHPSLSFIPSPSALLLPPPDSCCCCCCRCRRWTGASLETKSGEEKQGSTPQVSIVRLALF